MPLSSVVETARLTLRAPVAADRDEWIALHRDPRTYWHAPHAMAATDEAAEEFFEESRNHWDDKGFGFWVARDRQSGEAVGVCGLKEIDGARGAFLNLYYRLGFDHQGRGLGKEMSRASAAHAVEFLPDLPVWALIKEVNVPSVRTALTDPESVRNAAATHGDAPPPPRPITANERAFRAMVRQSMWRRVELADRDNVNALALLEAAAAAVPEDGRSAVMTYAAWDEALAAYWDEHGSIGLDGDARSPQLLQIEPDTAELPGLDDETEHRIWRVRQVLADPADDRDWVIEAIADLDASDAAGELVMTATALRRL